MDQSNLDPWKQLLESSRSAPNDTRALVLVCGCPDSKEWNIPHSADCLTSGDFDYIWRRAPHKISDCEICMEYIYLPHVDVDRVIVDNSTINPTSVVICLDWMSELSQWPALLSAWLQWLEKALEDHLEQRKCHFKQRNDDTWSDKSCISLIIACFNHHKVPNMGLNSATEYAQHWLRTQALLLGASIVYADKSAPVHEMILQSLDVDVDDSTHQLERNLVGNVLIQRGWDSRDKILATSKAFPFDEVMSGINRFPLSPGSLTIPSVPMDAKVEPVDLERISNQFAHGPVLSGTIPVLGNHATSTNESDDDRTAMKSFLNNLIDKNGA